MSTIQSVYTGQDVERPGWYNNLPFNLGILALFAAGIASCGTGFALGVVGVILIPIGIALCILPIILIRRVSKRQRHRQRYWVHFLFAGEGTFTTALEEEDARTQFLRIGTRSSVQPARRTTTRRNPDYSVWSYDEEWAARFYEAVNEARIAREAR